MKQLRLWAGVAVLATVPNVGHAQTMGTAPKAPAINAAASCVGDQAEAVSLSFTNTSRTQGNPRFKEGDHVQVTGVIKNTCSSGTREIGWGILQGSMLQHGGIATLGPGETKSVQYQWTARRGTHTFRITADPSHKLNETNRTNNTRSSSITVVR